MSLGVSLAKLLWHTKRQFLAFWFEVASIISFLIIYDTFFLHTFLIVVASSVPIPPLSSCVSVVFQICWKGNSLVLQNKKCKYSDNIKWTNEQTNKILLWIFFITYSTIQTENQDKLSFNLIYTSQLVQPLDRSCLWLKMVFQMRWIERQWNFVKCSLFVDSYLDTKLVPKCCTLMMSNNHFIAK